MHSFKRTEKSKNKYKSKRPINPESQNEKNSNPRSNSLTRIIEKYIKEIQTLYLIIYFKSEELYVLYV